MCSGDRLVADFVAGTDARPGLPEELQEHLTTTVNGLWVVWAHKLARHVGDLFVPLTGGPGYPADARAECRSRAPRRSRRPRSGVHVRLPRPLEPGVAGAARPRALHGADRCTVRTGAGLRVGRRRGAVAGGAADRGSHRAAGPVRSDGRSPGQAPPSRRSRRSPRCRPRCPTSRFGADTAEPARLLLRCCRCATTTPAGARGPARSSARRHLWSDLARAVPAGGATLPPAGLRAAQIRTIRAAHRVGRASLAAAHSGSCSR